MWVAGYYKIACTHQEQSLRILAALVTIAVFTNNLYGNFGKTRQIDDFNFKRFRKGSWMTVKDSERREIIGYSIEEREQRIEIGSSYRRGRGGGGAV